MQKLSVIAKVCMFLCILFASYLLVLFYRSAESSFGRAKEESRSGSTILQKLGKLMILPAVQPTIAMVMNKDLLKQKSPFFNRAKKGDAIIIYPDKVIIFDVDTGKIVDIGLSNKKDTTATPSGLYQR